MNRETPELSRLAPHSLPPVIGPYTGKVIPERYDRIPCDYTLILTEGRGIQVYYSPRRGWCVKCRGTLLFFSELVSCGGLIDDRIVDACRLAARRLDMQK